MMKIAYFTDTFLPQVNGIATSLANQARQLGEQNHNVLIFTPKLDGIPREKFQAKNVKVVHLPTVPALVYPEFKIGVFGLPKVIKHLAEFKPDIIHLHTPLTVGMDAVMAARLFRKPLVGTVHTSYNESTYLKWLKYNLAVKLADKAMQRIQNFMFNQCDLVLVPSKLLIEELKENGFRKKAFYLPNGVILEKPKILSEEEKSSIKEKYGLKEKVILHFGRLSQEKNIDLLVKAFVKLAKKHNNISMLIIGDGPTKKGLIKLTKKLGIEEKVVFTGFIDHQELISSGLLSIGDVFATASTMENNPMAVLEAMVFGLPIIGVKQAGLVELVSSNGCLTKAGDINELEECMEKILFNQKIAKKMSEESQDFIRQYSVDKITNKLLGLYNQTIKLNRF